MTRSGAPASAALAYADASNFRSLALIASLDFHQIGTTRGVFGAIRWFALYRPRSVGLRSPEDVEWTKS